MTTQRQPQRLHGRIAEVSIAGFRSLQRIDKLPLPQLTVLIGANGASKSGFMRFFEMLGWMLRARKYHAADWLTTLVDYYGFQDAGNRTCARLEQDILDGVMKRAVDVDPRYVRPYVQMHEFEALLFSDVEQFRHVLDGWDDAVRQALIDIRAQFQTPEDINNNRRTAPSKRILAAFPGGSYNKTEHGPLIASAIGLAKIRQQCPRFNGWKLGMSIFSKVDSHE